jgi:hypothetical protein
MVRIAIGADTLLHLHRGSFVSSPGSRVPSGFSMRRRGRRRGSSYLPVVVLNSQDPGPVQDRAGQQQQHAVTRAERWPGAFSLPDLSLGGLLGSRSDPVAAASDLHGSHSGGGCGGGGLSSTDLLLFLTALAASVFFLNQAILMNIGRKRRSAVEPSPLLPLLQEGEALQLGANSKARLAAILGSQAGLQSRAGRVWPETQALS